MDINCILNQMYYKKNKKGVSGIIATIIMVGMVIATISIVWNFVNDIVEDRLSESESCFGIFGEVAINSEYTCYNFSSNALQFSISMGDIDVDEVLVSISGEGTTQGIKIGNVAQTIIDVTNYPSGSVMISLPQKNSGSTYIKSNVATKPDSIKIAPIINQKQCEISDLLSEIDNCLTLQV